jgi:MFS family permease
VHAVRRSPLLLATALMVMAMWLSKTLQPLWFDQRGDLPNFGVSTTAMAVAGLSAFWAHRIVGRRSIPAVLAASCALYGVGMALRVFTGSVWVAVASGAIAGLGASTFLAAVRIDVARQPEERQRTAATRREGAVQVGTVAGTLLAALLLAVIGRSLWIGLLAAPVLLVLAAAAGGRVPGRTTADTEVETDGGGEAAVPADQTTGGRTRRDRVRVVAVWAARGFGASILIPYIPLLLEDRGVARAGIGVVLAAAALGRLLALRAVPAVDRRVGSRAAAGTSELLLAALTLALVPSLGPIVVVIVVLLRYAVMTFATVTQDLVLFTMGSSVSLVGAAQASFLVGDAGAGLIAPHLWSGSGDAALVLAAAIAILTATTNSTRVLPPALAVPDASR